MSQEWRDKYNQRISSKEWQELRHRLIAARGNQCQCCKKSGITLQLHHDTYERLGEERDEDLAVLCIPCHEKADTYRAAQGRVRSDMAMHNTRVNGWASKKYGEDWQDLGDPESIHEEFQDWIERQY